MGRAEFKDFQSPDEASTERLIEALDRAYHRPGLLMWRSFLQGVMTAFGAFVGTVLISILAGYLFYILGGAQALQENVTKWVQKSLPTGLLGPSSFFGGSADTSAQTVPVQYTQEELEAALELAQQPR